MQASPQQTSAPQQSEKTRGSRPGLIGSLLVLILGIGLLAAYYFGGFAGQAEAAEQPPAEMGSVAGGDNPGPPVQTASVESA